MQRMFENLKKRGKNKGMIGKKLWMFHYSKKKTESSNRTTKHFYGWRVEFIKVLGIFALGNMKNDRG